MRGQPSLLRARISSEELRTLLVAIRRHRQDGYGRLADDLGDVFTPRRDGKSKRKELGLQRYSTEGLKSRMKAINPILFSEDEIANILTRLDRLIPDAMWAALPEFAQPIVKKIFRPNIDLTNALADWSGAPDNQTDFVNDRTSPSLKTGNGNYLILRLSPSSTDEQREAGSLLCSHMFILSPSPKNPLAQFLTRRPDLKGREHYIRGVIFERDNLIYSIGRARLAKGFRTALMEGHNRGTDRYDMFGSRLGIQGQKGPAFAYPVYCYQLKRRRSRTDLNTMLGRKSEDSDILKREINGFDEILSKLKQAATSPFGVEC